MKWDPEFQYEKYFAGVVCLGVNSWDDIGANLDQNIIPRSAIYNRQEGFMFI